MLIVLAIVAAFSGGVVVLVMAVGAGVAAVIFLGGVLAAFLAYVLLVRPWHIRWGAETVEASRAVDGGCVRRAAPPSASMRSWRQASVAGPLERGPGGGRCAG